MSFLLFLVPKIIMYHRTRYCYNRSKQENGALLNCIISLCILNFELLVTKLTV